MNLYRLWRHGISMTATLCAGFTLRGIAPVIIGFASVCIPAAARAVPMEAIWTGTIQDSSDSSNWLGYGGGGLADGHRVTLIFRWDTSAAPPPIISNGYYDYFTNGTFPATIPSSWISSTVHFDNGLTLSSINLNGNYSATDQVKVGDNITGSSLGLPIGDSFDHFGNYDSISDQNLSHTSWSEYTVSARIFDSNQRLLSGVNIDQTVVWRPRMQGNSYNDGYISLKRYSLTPDGSTTVIDASASGRFSFDSLTVHRSANLTPTR